jgi:peptidoglycan hydrolase CwlO-like protein
MGKRIKKVCSIILAFVILLISFALFLQSASADDVTPTPTPTPTSAPSVSDIGDCGAKNLSPTDCVNYYQSKLDDTVGQEKTLSSQIDAMDNQINLTQAQIISTQQQIGELNADIKTTSTKISTIEGSLSGLTKVLLDHIVATYKVGTNQDFGILLSSSNISDFFERANYLRIVQAHDKQLIYDTVQAKNDYANQQNIFEDKKQQVEALQTQLQAYTTQLDQEKSDKQRLLTETQGDEETYQRLLSQAQAQLEGFSNFASSQGGASLLSGQTSCDSWGCYYNQRDTQWGSVALGGSSYSIASDGCLMTSMAMVYTHYGHRSVTPLSINSDPDNFASYNRAYLLRTITADGASSSRVGGSIDSELSAGRPVIVGISYDGGPIADHFVVLVSGSNGNYIMKDPFVPNGNNISFTSHYSLGSIVEVDAITGL